MKNNYQMKYFLGIIVAISIFIIGCKCPSNTYVVSKCPPSEKINCSTKNGKIDNNRDKAVEYSIEMEKLDIGIKLPLSNKCNFPFIIVGKIGEEILAHARSISDKYCRLGIKDACLNYAYLFFSQGLPEFLEKAETLIPLLNDNCAQKHALSCYFLGSIQFMLNGINSKLANKNYPLQEINNNYSLACDLGYGEACLSIIIERKNELSMKQIKGYFAKARENGCSQYLEYEPYYIKKDVDGLKKLLLLTSYYCFRYDKSHEACIKLEEIIRLIGLEKYLKYINEYNLHRKGISYLKLINYIYYDIE